MLAWYRRYRRRRLLAQPYPLGWESVLRRNVAHYDLVSSEERARLRNDLRVLVTEKHWVGCRGLEVTEEMKVTIAAQASLLLLGLEHDYFGRVLSILVYPGAFRFPRGEWEDERARGQAIAGVAWYRGPVILAWDTVLAEGRDPSGGHNLVIHEFAHQLDFLDGLENETPILKDAAESERWYEVMTEEFQRLQRELGAGRPALFGEHAAQSETEFFAGVSEHFFTRPTELRHHHRPLYDLLADYYRVNPVRWFGHIPERRSPIPRP